MNIKATLFGAAIAQLPVGAVAQSYGKYETPPYVVEARLGEIEVRKYAPHVLAEVTVRGDERQALNQGFRLLAGYIFGGNTAQHSIDMTAPVGQSGTSDVWTVTFTMPSEWTLDTLPTPNSDAVRFRDVLENRQVVYTFSGRATSAALAEAEAKLRAEAAANELETYGPLNTYYYDDPMTLPWKRRNEVALALAPS